MLCQLSGLPSAKLTRKINCRMVVHSFNICRGPVNSWLWDDEDVNTGLLFLEFLKSSRSQNTGLGERDRGGPVSTGKRRPRGWCPGPGKHRLGRLASCGVCVCACHMCTHTCHPGAVTDSADTAASMSGPAG